MGSLIHVNIVTGPVVRVNSDCDNVPFMDPADFPWKIIFYVLGATAIIIGWVVKDKWLTGFTYRDGTEASPLAARVLLLVVGAGMIIMMYFTH